MQYMSTESTTIFFFFFFGVKKSTNKLLVRLDHQPCWCKKVFSQTIIHNIIVDLDVTFLLKLKREVKRRLFDKFRV